MNRYKWRLYQNSTKKIAKYLVHKRNKMKIEEVKVEDLIPYEFNNKIHDEQQINRIANSIKEFWFLQPLVIDENNILIVWHWRLQWAIKLWLKQVPCIRAENLTPTQIKKYRILDNKLNDSERDLWNLKLELDELWDLNFWDLELEIGDIFPEMQTDEFNPDDVEDDFKEKPTKFSLVVYVQDEWELAMLKKDLDELWYKYR